MDNITLVGRASNVGTAEQEFTIICRRADGPVHTFRCECRNARSREAFAAIADDDLIGIIGTIAKGTSSERTLVLIDRLERLPG